MEVASLLPDPRTLHLSLVSTEDAVIVLHVETIRPQAPCPDCGALSARIHSRYRRTVQDLPWQGVAIRLQLYTRRFFCSHSDCARTIFTERLPNVVERYARRTDRLQMAIALLGYALGGEAGARVAANLGLSASPDTLLRRVRELAQIRDGQGCATGFADDRKVDHSVRVVGVDDWAYRRGQRYGTILVDLERHRVIDLLPDRTGASLAEWLRAHPGVEVVSRDRGGAYADGVRQGAPSAQQVADRFHLLKNAVETLERCLARHHDALREAAKAVTTSNAAIAADVDVSAESAKATANSAPPSDTPTGRRERESRASRERRLARYKEVVELHRQGATIRAIADHFRMNRRTVRQFLRATSFPERAIPKRRNQIDAYKRQLREKWDDGCHCAAVLFRELKAHGYTGCESSLRAYLRQWRPQVSAELSRGRKRRPGLSPPQPVFSPRSVAWLLVKGSTANLSARQAVEEAMAKRLLDTCPEAKAGQELARSFFQIIRESQADKLDDWLSAAGASELPEFRAFAKGLSADRDALLATLTTSWSNGQVEGQVNRLKFIKRAMYGRANFDLLRARVMPMARSA